MPATAGRVRMPHNNRVSTSSALATSDIWSKTIGHDPYAASSELDGETAEAQAENERRTKGFMELARHQNLANGTSSGGKDDSFSQKMFLGLKQRKGGRNKKNGQDGGFGHVDACDRSESSSEEEFLEVQVENDDNKAEEKKRSSTSRKKDRSSKKRKKKKERRKRDDSSSSDSDTSDEKDDKKGKKRRRHRRRHGSKNRHRSGESSDEDDRDRKHRRSDRDGRKKRHK